jgi:5-methylcytosine-specific restriction endonuclease McrA
MRLYVRVFIPILAFTVAGVEASKALGASRSTYEALALVFFFGSAVVLFIPELRRDTRLKAATKAARLDAERRRAEQLHAEQQDEQRRRAEYLQQRAEQLRAGPQRKRPSRDMRRTVYHRDGGRCVYCGSTFDLQYDHIVPVVRGGGTSVENLQLLCGECNQRKGKGF